MPLVTLALRLDARGRERLCVPGYRFRAVVTILFRSSRRPSSLPSFCLLVALQSLRIDLSSQGPTAHIPASP